MFEWALNVPLKLVEYKHDIYIMLFEMQKIFQFIFGLWLLGTYDIFLYFPLTLCVLQRLVRNIKLNEFYC